MIRKRGRPASKKANSAYKAVKRLPTPGTSTSKISEQVAAEFPALTGPTLTQLSQAMLEVTQRYCGQFFILKAQKGRPNNAAEKMLIADCARAWTQSGCTSDPWQRQQAYGTGRAPAVVLAMIAYTCATGKKLPQDIRRLVASAKKVAFLND